MAVPINKQARAILSSLLETFDAIDQLGSLDNAMAERRLALQQLTDEHAKREQEHQQRVNALTSGIAQKVLDAAQIVEDAKREAEALINGGRLTAAGLVEEANAAKQVISDQATALLESINASKVELERLNTSIEVIAREEQTAQSELNAIREAIANLRRG